MSGFMRWLASLIVILGLGTLSVGCQLVFGDYNLGNRARGGGGEGGQGGAGASGGSSPGYGGAGTGQATGPISVVPTSDLFTSDRGAQAKFYVALTQKPTAAVTISIASNNPAEGIVNPASLAFTTEDWNAPQVVTVTGVYDPNPGNQAYTVAVGPATSDDPVFQGAQATVSLTNIDNDSPGFFVTPTMGLVTTEAGGQAFFTVVLNKIPSADVVITLSSSDDSIGQATPASLTFTAANWSAPQTVTVTGINDDIAEGDRSYQIIVDSLMSLDPAFAKLPAQAVNVKNLDNDHAGVMLALATGIDPSDTTRLRTSENGDSATFTVVLNKKPTKDVTIDVASNSMEGQASPTSLTFTDVNWSAPQTVTVLGLNNDNVADGNQPYQVKLGPITSDDAAYGALTVTDLPSVNVINVDNDKADISIVLLTGVDPKDASELLTSEKKATAQFSIALTSKPTSVVHFTLTSTNTAEGIIDTAQVDFTAETWNSPKTVTVTGVDDDNTKDGNVVYAVRINTPTTDDLGYQKLPSTDVKVVNLDDDVAGITQPKLLTGIDNNTKLSTTEGGGTASFSVSLTSKPTADVKVPVTSSTPTEGKVSPTLLTFTPANYATAQVVTVTGQKDVIPTVDGNQAYTVTVGPSTSDDMNYVGLSQSVKVTNNDIDSAYIVVTPGYDGTTTEKGGATTFAIRLSSQPTVSVTLTFSAIDAKEGKATPSSMTFTRDNWSTTQNYTVTGVDDAVDDGDNKYSVTVKGSGTEPNYMYAATTLTITNQDDDTAGYKLTPSGNLQTTEAGGPAMFTVALTSQPIANVTVTLTSSAPKEGAVTSPSSGSLTFTAMNWSNAQPVTVTGVDDFVADINQPYTVALKGSSTDPKYNQLASSVSLTNTNDDVFGIVITQTTCETQPGTTATFSVGLKSQPLGPVSIALSVAPATEASVAPTPLSFTPSSWSAQQVTITGLDDGTMGASTPYKIVTAAAVSAMDSNYNGLNAVDIDCVNKTVAPPPPAGP